MRKMKLFNWIAPLLLAVWFFMPAQAALFNQACSPVSGCTANDIGVQDIKITFVDDGCTGPTDTALVQMEVNASSSGPNRYDIGMFINTAGENSAATGDGATECLHEALFEVGSPVGHL